MPGLAKMTDTRWRNVCVGLVVLLSSYAIPDMGLKHSHVSSRHRQDMNTLGLSPSQLEKFKSITSFEGNGAVFFSLFKNHTFPSVGPPMRGSSFKWAEGPTHLGGDLFYFSDVIGNAMYSWAPWPETAQVMTNSGDLPSGTKMYEPGSNGLFSDPKNRDILYIAQHGARRVIKYNRITGEKTVLADKYNGKSLNCPNDLALDAAGEYIYFTDPLYCLLEEGDQNKDGWLERVKAKSALGFQGIYRVKTSGDPSSIELLNDKLKCPNGIAFSPDFSHLYVSDSWTEKNILKTASFKIHKFSVEKSGKLKEKDVWTDKSVGGIGDLTKMKGVVDGFAFHPKGYLVASCPGGYVCVLSEDGKLKVRLYLSKNVFVTNVAFSNNFMLITAGSATFVVAIKN